MKYLGYSIDVKAESQIHFLGKAWIDGLSYVSFMRGMLRPEVEAVPQEDDFAVLPSSYSSDGRSTEEYG